MMRVVLDTNILVSALLWPGRAPSHVVSLARHHKIKNVTSFFILEEFRRVLHQKFGFETHKVESAAGILLEHSEIIEPRHRVGSVCADPKDNPILECALSGKVRWIVTGDKDLLALDPFKGIRIVAPREFVDRFYPRDSTFYL